MPKMVDGKEMGTVADLLEGLSVFPVDLPIVWNYDTGHSYPTFERLQLMQTLNGEEVLCVIPDDLDKTLYSLQEFK